MSTSTSGKTATPSNPQHTQLFLDGVKDYAIFMLDTSGHVVSWNHGANLLFGYSSNEVIGQHFSCFFVPEDIRSGRPAEDLREAERQGQISGESWHVRKDGTRFWATQVTTALREERGELQGFAQVLRDTTDRKRLEMELRRQADELAEANRRKDELLAMLSHELRNPLAPVLNSVHIIESSSHDPEVVKLASNIISRQVRHMARLIDDLLEVTRITHGKVHLHLERVELGGAVRRAAESVAIVMNERGHSFIIDVSEEPVWVEADPTRLDQILVNLLDNSAKYTDPRGRVEIKAAREGADGVVRVRDNGMGIAPEILPRIFDLFAQADRSLDRGRGGLGIGLTLVRSLVTMHGGTVEAFSEGQNRGTELVVRLPALQPPEREANVAPLPFATPVSPLRMLVVDDNPDTATSLGMLLRLYGHQVEQAHSGPQALTVLESQSFDAILLDIGLPGMDGCEVARRIRAKEKGSSLLLIAISGYGFETDRQRSREAGFDHHLVKPVDLADLQPLLLSFASSEARPDSPDSQSAPAGS